MRKVGVERIDFLKIDIEGGELVLFAEAYRGWLDCTTDIAIELHGDECERALIGALADYAYTVERSGELTICSDITRKKSLSASAV